MSKTQLNGGRIRRKSLTFDHFVDGVKIPEASLLLQYPLHNHANKGVIDRIRYSGTAENVDLRNLDLVLLEVTTARRNGNNLGGTIDDKADRSEIIMISDEMAYARGSYETLADAIQAYGAEVDNKILAHLGTIGHVDLDAMFSDYVASKAGMDSLAARLVSLGDGTGGTGGDPVYNLLKPWTYRVTLVASAEGTVDRKVSIPYPFTESANTIQVFEGPLLMLPGATGDYVENLDNSITFNYDLPTETDLTITGVSAGTLYVWRQVYRTTEEQRVFGTMDVYVVGADEIIVYESGLLMTKNVDYTEIDEHTIRFTDPLPSGLDVVICRRR